MKKVLITGVSGFAGSFLAERLVSENNVDVYGVYLNEKTLSNLSSIRDRVKLLRLDLSDGKGVLKLIGEEKPDYIYHLAALPSSGESFEMPYHTFQSNVQPEINILEALRKLDLNSTRVMIVSSAEIYGLVAKKDLPIDENTPFNPTNPYAVSKLAQDFLGLQYFLSHKLQIIRVRPFNHIGPRQSSDFVVSAFAKKIAEIEKGKREPILPVGNLESSRDFTDVRDMVRAYHLAIEKGEVGDVYNIGSGKSYKISEILRRLLLLSRVNIKIETDKILLRPSDNPILLCDKTKFSNLTGWELRIPIEKTLKDTLEYWRNII